MATWIICGVILIYAIWVIKWMFFRKKAGGHCMGSCQGCTFYCQKDGKEGAGRNER